MAAAKTLVTLDTGLSKTIKGQSFANIIARGELLSISLEDQSRQSQLSPLLNDPKYVVLPDGVVYSKKHGRLYFTNMGIPPQNDGFVCSVRPDGTDPQIVLSKGQIHTPKQLALDDVHDKLYISDREGLRVMRCNLDGSSLETLVQTGDFNDSTHARDQTRWCVGITVSPRTGLFYWTQKGASKPGTGRIFSAPIEGSELREPTLLLDSLPEPIDLEIEESTNTLYWTDRGEVPYGNSFNRMALDDTGTSPGSSSNFTPTVGLKHEVLVSNFNETIGLCHDKDAGRWYIADIGGTIWSFAEDGSGKSVVYSEEQRSFTGITLVS